MRVLVRLVLLVLPLLLQPLALDLLLPAHVPLLPLPHLLVQRRLLPRIPLLLLPSLLPLLLPPPLLLRVDADQLLHLREQLFRAPPLARALCEEGRCGQPERVAGQGVAGQGGAAEATWRCASPSAPIAAS